MGRQILAKMIYLLIFLEFKKNNVIFLYTWKRFHVIINKLIGKFCSWELLNLHIGDFLGRVKWDHY